VDIASIASKITSHASKTGLFENVVGHEPKSAPGAGMTCAAWGMEIGPMVSGSGLDYTSALLLWRVELYLSMLTEPMDDIDPRLMTAASTLIGEYSGDFDLGGETRNIDLLGESGTTLKGRMAYKSIDNKIFRTCSIDLAIVVNDVWAQAPGGA
jgi:hypothetical protein